MASCELTILIPARNERWLARTIEDIFAHAEMDTEVVAVLDGAWADPPIPDHPRLTLIHHATPVGQRAACNQAARVARGKYLMKVDAHCAFDQGFDRKLLELMQDDWTMVPVMRNLHVFNWMCPDGHARYQGPSGPCQTCGKATTMDVVWISKERPQSKSYCFDSTPHFQYFRDWLKRPEVQPPLTDTMSLQGSAFLCTAERYWTLGLCDESWGSWGSQGIEVACKTWLSGGRVVVNHSTWYAHCFRTQGGDFGFPYPLKQSAVEEAKKRAREAFFEGRWPHASRPLSWLVKKFWPVPGWTEQDVQKLGA